MRERAVQLDGENKIGIRCRRFLCPQLSLLGLDVSVERSVDLDEIEILRHVLHGMLGASQVRRVDDSFPVFVGPSRGADKNVGHARNRNLSPQRTRRNTEEKRKEQ